MQLSQRVRQEFVLAMTEEEIAWLNWYLNNSALISPSGKIADGISEKNANFRENFRRTTEQV